MEESFNQLQKEFNSLRVAFTECRTELALSKCKLDAKIAELQRQVAALIESNVELLRRVNELSPQKVVAPWEKSSKSEKPSEPSEPKSEERTNDKIEAAEKPKSTEKPKAKNWDAICDAELIDDEEEEERRPVPKEAPKSPAPLSILEKIQQSRPNVPQEHWDIIENFMCLFRAYLDSLSRWSIEPLKQNLGIGPFALTQLVDVLLQWKYETPEFVPLAQAILLEMPKMCDEKELICWACGFRMFTPLNMFDHLIEPSHVLKMQHAEELYRFPAQAVQQTLGRLSAMLKRSNLGQRGEVELMTKGEARFRMLKDDPRLRPTKEYMRDKMQEYLSLACGDDEKAIMLVNVGGMLKPDEDEYRMRVIRKWIKKNRERFIKELDQHLSTGVAYCLKCEVAYDSKADYYRHVTSYLHAVADQTMFGGYMIRLARGEEDWSITS